MISNLQADDIAPR